MNNQACSSRFSLNILGNFLIKTSKRVEHVNFRVCDELTHATMLKQKSVYLMQAMLRARRAALSPRESAAVPIV
jgi:hypothetical protein